MKDPLIQQALDALIAVPSGAGIAAYKSHWTAIEALRARLAEPDPEPVRWLYKADSGEHVETQQLDYTYRLGDGYAKGIPLYTAPPTPEATPPHECPWAVTKGALRLCQPPKNQRASPPTTEGMVFVPIELQKHWQVSGGLLYALDECGVNSDCIRIEMVGHSPHDATAINKVATQLAAMIQAGSKE